MKPQVVSRSQLEFIMFLLLFVDEELNEQSLDYLKPYEDGMCCKWINECK